MREILFRGKRTDNAEWVEGSLFQEDGWTAVGAGGEKSSCYIIEKEPLDIRCYITGNAAFADNEFIQVSEKTVGQYTGLCDKNGKKIFEGDILRACLNPEICICAVNYNDNIAAFIANPVEHETQFLTFLDYKIAEHEVGESVWFEVIGNIHDNPELLER